MLHVNRAIEKNVVDINDVTSSESSCEASASDGKSFSEVNSDSLQEIRGR
jgi:hypothetical protein